jgi:translation initiation factor 5B
LENAVEGLDLEDGETQGDMQAAKKPLEVTAEDMTDEDWGPVKGKKGKKGKGKNVKAEVENDEQPSLYQLHSAHLGISDLWMSIAVLRESGSPSVAAPQVENGEDESKEPDAKVLSKKE